MNVWYNTHFLQTSIREYTVVDICLYDENPKLFFTAALIWCQEFSPENVTNILSFLKRRG